MISSSLIRTSNFVLRALHSASYFCSVVSLIVFVVCLGCGTGEPDLRPLDGRDQVSAQVIAFCGACHGTPDPASFPKDEWHHEVKQGFDFYVASGRTDLKSPAFNDVVSWYRDRAPVALRLAAVTATPSPVRWKMETLRGPDVGHVSHLAWDGGEKGGLLLCDMKANAINRLQLRQGRLAVVDELIQGTHPAHIECVDLDRDGRLDYVVAELGSFSPQDHSLGRVSWLRMLPSGVWTRSSLLENVGRVADVRAGDFDRDGDVDLIVAEFGWRRTGRTLLLRQESQTADDISFRPETIDERHGVIHVPAADLDNDGDLDFVALVSQEFEEVDAFLNLGNGTFERQIIHLAGDPAFGSSGIQLIDFDQDGDLDVLYTNGDSLDSKYVKPYHGVRWLENMGDYPFDAHEIALLPGAAKALAIDIDRDGDLDVVASAWIPEDLANAELADMQYDSLIWLERKNTQEFERHVISSVRRFGYLAIEVGDLDKDGDTDLVAGWFGGTSSGKNGTVDIFWNEGSNRLK